ncbi:MAG TPA: hypothetical protein PKD20_04645, partial [Candidatus Saccharibacteria bacterium]|nr:hypothetical protein [Candidatus Saccharibacteria bacterium]
MKQRPMTGSEALYLSDTNIPAAIEQFKISGDSIDRQLSELGIGTFTPIIEQEPPVVPQPKLPIDELLAQVGVRVSEAESLAASKEATRRFMLDLHVIETRSQHISKFDRLRQFVTKNVAHL